MYLNLQSVIHSIVSTDLDSEKPHLMVLKFQMRKYFIDTIKD